MGLISKLFAKPPKQTTKPDAFAVGVGSQHTLDTKRILTLDRNTFFAGLSKWQRLTLFDTIAESSELAAGILNIITRFANSRMLPVTDDTAIAQRMREIWAAIDGHKVNAMLIRQALISGFAAGEPVWDIDTRQMLRVVVPPSIEIRKIPDRHGQIQSFVQLPGFMLGSRQTVDGRKPIPPEKMIDVIRDPKHSFQYYGNSIFQNALDQFESLAQIMDSSIKIIMRSGRPRFHVQIDATDLTPEQLQERITLTKNAMEGMGDLDASDLHTPAGVTIAVIGSETLGVKVVDEVRLIVSNILACVGIPPALLNVSIQASAGAESFSRQQIISMMTVIDEIQRSHAAAWQSFWTIVAKLEGWSTVPSIAFEKPRLLDQTIEETARDLRFTNDSREVAYGIRPPEWLAGRCGVTEADDLELLKERARAEPEPEQSKQSDSVSADSTTKITDKRASSNTTL